MHKRTVECGGYLRDDGLWEVEARQKIGPETCTHLSELLGLAVTALFQTMSYGKTPEGGGSLDNQRSSTEQPFFIGGLANRWIHCRRDVSAIRDQASYRPPA
ncbi:MAG: hypothetical protein WAV72_20420 [Bradyrhizobium sp.]